MNDYSPMTANEAGGLGKALDEALVELDAATPSKPCTEGGDHCFCVSSDVQHLVPDHQDMLCCWCEKFSCISLSSQRVPGHGPYRTELVRE